MKKIGIITIISKNYGNRLQNYALQKYLEKQGFLVYTIPQKKRENKIKMIIKLLLSIKIDKYKSVFWDVFDGNIKWSKYVRNLDVLNDKFDFFITGSDQVWNPLFEFNSEREFLTFANEKKRIAYAASIGLDFLPNKYIFKYRDLINNIPQVSVREYEGANIIKEICNRDVPVLLDPTMLLSKNEWKKISEKSYLKKKKLNRYVLKYFLGIKNKKYDAYIEEFAKQNSLEIVDISSNNINKNGPYEFLYYIENAKFIFTDSFHGTVFSLLFEKKFRVFTRPEEKGYGDMSSRINTLIKHFEIGDYVINNEEEIKKVVVELDYTKISKILELKRKEAKDYLTKALK